MPVSLALYQPDIPQNTGTLIRLGACLDFDLHIIHPTGFPFSDKHLKRAGMDYADRARVREHASFSAFEEWRRRHARRLVLMTTRARRSVYDTRFEASDVLLAGRESAGVPQHVADGAGIAVRIPMAESLRSLNVAVASAMVIGEAKRQTNGFDTLK